jgi:hypothetical protein
MKNLSILAIPSVLWRDDFPDELDAWFKSHPRIWTESDKFNDYLSDSDDVSKDAIIANIRQAIYSTSSAVLTSDWRNACQLGLPDHSGLTVWAVTAQDLQHGPGFDSKYEFFELINDSDSLMAFLEQRAQVRPYWRKRLAEAFGLKDGLIPESAVITGNSAMASIGRPYHWEWVYLLSQGLADADGTSANGAIHHFTVNRIGCRRLGLTMDQTRAAIELG